MIDRLRARALKLVGFASVVGGSVALSACCGLAAPVDLCCSGASCLLGAVTVVPAAAVAESEPQDVELPNCMAGDDESAACMASAEVAY